VSGRTLKRSLKKPSAGEGFQMRSFFDARHGLGGILAKRKTSINLPLARARRGALFV